MKSMTRILSIVTLILSVILAVGILYVFHACGAKDDGSWMACHWAQQTVAALGVVLAVQSVIAVISRTSTARAAASGAMIPTALMAILVPGNLIHLCMMSDMQCQSVMKPAVWLIAGVILLLAIVNTLLSSKSHED